jgi:hypothetical protein
MKIIKGRRFILAEDFLVNDTVVIKKDAIVEALETVVDEDAKSAYVQDLSIKTYGGGKWYVPISMLKSAQGLDTPPSTKKACSGNCVTCRGQTTLGQAVRITNGSYQGKVATIIERFDDYCYLKLKTFDKAKVIACYYADLEPYDAVDVPVAKSDKKPKELQPLPDIVVCKPDDDGKYHDAHYANMAGLEPIELMQLVMSREEFIGFLKGNIIKYTMRAGHKQGEAAEKDIAKAKRYKQWLMEMLYIEKIIDPKKED